MSLRDSLETGAWKLQLPVSFPLDDRVLCLSESLRLLPGKRATMSGTWAGRSVVAKLFLPLAKKEQAAEVRGYQALQQAGIAAPELLWSGKLEGGLYGVVYEKLEDAQTLSEGLRSKWRSDLLAVTCELLAKMYRAGIWQDDIHLDNFLMARGKLHVIDNASLRVEPGRPLSAERSLNNLAAFISQFSWRERAALLRSPCLAMPLDIKPENARRMLAETSRKLWWRRVKKYVKKVFRNCTEVAMEKRAGWYLAYKRQLDAAWVASFRGAPDSVMARGTVLKDGDSATVVRADIAGRPVVIKRYNIKSSGHRLRRLFRETRGANAWRAGHLLKLAGIKTPQPLVLLEQRRGPLRGVAYLVTEDAGGVEMLNAYQHREPTERELEDVAEIFRVMRELKLCHGDFKAKNLLVTDRGVEMIDLDVFHVSPSSRFRHCMKKDRERFLRNWHAHPAIEARFKALLAEPNGEA